MSLELMKRRLGYQGGAPQQDRMIQDKLKSMLSATKYSYQAAKFSKWGFEDKISAGLFNPITQTQDYDTKRISVPFDANYQVGDVVKWHNTNTYWIIFLQDKTELAYFRGQCRRCDYKVQWVDGNRQLHSAPMSVIGPTNPMPGTNLTMNTAVDTPSANLVCLVSDNIINREYFTRYQKFLLKGKTYKIDQIDNLSMPGIIQINATEFYTNQVEDDEGIRNSYNVHPIVEEHITEYAIDGPRAIKPFYEATFTTFVNGGYWGIREIDELPQFQKDKYPAQFTDEDTSQKIVHLKWSSPKTGNFTLEYHTAAKTYQFNVIVESLM